MIPVAQEATTHLNDDDIQDAVAILDWRILRERMKLHLEIAVSIVDFGFEEANRVQTRAALEHSYGWLFKSKQMEQSAEENEKRAKTIRSNAFKLGLIYLGIAAILNGTYWLVEQGLVKKAIESLSTLSNAIQQHIANNFHGIKFSIPFMSQYKKSTDIKFAPSAPPAVNFESKTKTLTPSAPPAPLAFTFSQQAAPSSEVEALVVEFTGRAITQYRSNQPTLA